METRCKDYGHLIYICVNIIYLYSPITGTTLQLCIANVYVHIRFAVTASAGAVHFHHKPSIKLLKLPLPSTQQRNRRGNLFNCAQLSCGHGKPYCGFQHNLRSDSLWYCQYVISTASTTIKQKLTTFPETRKQNTLGLNLRLPAERGPDNAKL